MAKRSIASQANGGLIAGDLGCEGWTTYTLNLSQIAPDAVGTDANVPARIDLGDVAGVRLQIRNMLIRPMSLDELAIRETAAMLTSQKEQLAARIEQYRSDDWPATIDSVDYDGSQVHLSGRFSSADSHDRPFLIARDPASVSADALHDPGVASKVVCHH